MPSTRNMNLANRWKKARTRTVTTIIRPRSDGDAEEVTDDDITSGIVFSFGKVKGEMIDVELKMSLTVVLVV